MKIMCKGLLIVTFIFCFFHSISQTQNYDDSAKYYYKLNNFPKAIFWSEKNVEYQKIHFGIKDTLYGKAINDLGVYNFLGGNYKIAKPLFLESLEILKTINGENNADYISTVGNLGNLHQRIGEYKQAENYLKLNISLLEKAKLTNTNDYPQAFNNLAYLYNALSKYEEAEINYLKALDLYKKQSGVETVQYARTLDNLGGVFLNTGRYSSSENAYLQSLEIRKKLLGEKDWQYGASLNNIASVYQALGNYISAENLFIKSTEIVRNQLGEKHPQYSIAIGNLSNLYKKIGKFDKAEELLLKSLEIINITSGKNVLPYCRALNNLGALYYTVNRIQEAEKVFLESISISNKISFETKLEDATATGNLGKCYASERKFSIADSCFKISISSRENLGLTNQIEYLDVCNSLIMLELDFNYFSLVDKQIGRQFELEKKQVSSKLNFLSQFELNSYVQNRDIFIALPYLSLWKNPNAEIVKEGYNIKLFFNSLSLNNYNNLSESIQKGNDKGLIMSWKNYKSNIIFLNKILSQPISKRIIDTDSLTNICNQQEKELLRNSTEYRGMKEKLNITWQDIRNRLTKNDAALEFVKFKNIKRKFNDKDTFNYAAMLLRKHDTVPIFIKLFEESKLLNALKTFAYKAVGKYEVSKNSKEDIYKLLWQPLEPYLKNTKTIYFSPDGLLHNIAFAAIPYKNNLLLSDKYNLIQLASTRQIAIKEKENVLPASIALFGGINYNKQNVDTSTTIVADPYSYVYQQSRGAGVDSFSYLPSTLKEVQGIKKSMEAKQKHVLLFSGDKATETAFKNLSNTTSPSVIHFATHGFTIIDTAKNNTTTNTFKVSDNPLLRSGLVLAGGNKGWQGKANANEDDGILTALEISSVQLPNTQLAVLSACETGVGELRGSEGVFGLQRAFKLAGVNYIMASLWQVPDKETAEFMNTFYSTWLSGKTIRQAFIATQQHMRKKYTPYYWAGFTLVQ